MAQNKMTQSQIEALINDSDLESSALKESQMESRVQQKVFFEVPTANQKYEQSNDYGEQQFEDFQQGKKASVLNNKLKKVSQVKAQKSSVYDSYGNEEFDSYEESKRTREFQSSEPSMKFNKKQQLQPLMPIEEYAANKLPSKKVNQKSPNSFQPSFHKAKNNNLIVTSKQPPKPKSRHPLITNPNSNDSKNIPYNYNRLQQRQKQLLITTLSQENKKLRQLLSERDKELATVKGKYNILLEQKAHVLGNAKQATLKKQLEQLQSKYDAIIKERTKQRAYKTVTMPMSKTMTNNFVSQAQAQQRQQELLMIVQKLKERLVSTDRELKTLQVKMNEGLDYQEELQRKLKRVEQLQLRMQKMKGQAEQDRALIQILKQKNKQQKNKIDQLQQQKNELSLCLKRAQMTSATQSDLRQQLEEAIREKNLLQKSLRELSLNFTSNLSNPTKKQPKHQPQNIIEDSNELLSYKK